MSKKNIALLAFCAIINLSSYAQTNYPADISFCIADIKFDGKNIKICELGQGSRSRFKGYDALYGKGKVWTAFWEYLAKFQKPFWIVTLKIIIHSKRYKF